MLRICLTSTSIACCRSVTNFPDVDDEQKQLIKIKFLYSRLVTQLTKTSKCNFIISYKAFYTNFDKLFGFQLMNLTLTSVVDNTFIKETRIQ